MAAAETELISRPPARTACSQCSRHLREEIMRKLLLAAAVALPVPIRGGAGPGTAVKIGYIDPLSGGGASVARSAIKTFQYLADEVKPRAASSARRSSSFPLDKQDHRRRA